MNDISNARFGEIINERRSYIFRKRPFKELDTQQQDTLKKINISTDMYDSFLNSSDSSIENTSSHDLPLLSTPSSQSDISNSP